MGEEVEIQQLEAGTPIEIPEEWQKHLGVKTGIYGGNGGWVDNPNKNVAPYVFGFNLGKFKRHGVGATPKEFKVKRLTGAAAGVLTRAFGANVKKLEVPVSPFTSGTDPEIFVVHGDGTLFSAFEFLGDKTKQKYYNDSGFYWDGFQAECYLPARACLIELHDRIYSGLRGILQEARKHDPAAKLTLQNTFQIPIEVLLKTAPEHVAFGCAPSYNVYRDAGGDIGDPRQFPYRFAGGHMHAGMIGKITHEMAEPIVKACDMVVGVAGVSLAEGIDDPIRRKVYGRAGEFRLPNHGLEYRVLSNFWLCDPAISHLVFELFRSTVRCVRAGMFKYVWQADENAVREVINNCDVQGARKMLEANKAGLLYLLQQRWPLSVDSKSAPLGVATVLNGIKDVVPNPQDIAANWKLEGSWGSNLCWSERSYRVQSATAKG